MQEPRRLTPADIKVGDTVGVWNGVPGSPVGNVEVIEDRGNVGYRGRRIYRVRVGVLPDSPEVLEYEVSIDDLVEPAAEPPARPRRQRRRPQPA